MNMMVDAFDDSPDVGVWILEEAGKNDSIYQMNVVEMKLQTWGLIESSGDVTWQKAKTVASQRSAPDQ